MQGNLRNVVCSILATDSKCFRFYGKSECGSKAGTNFPHTGFRLLVTLFSCNASQVFADQWGKGQPKLKKQHSLCFVPT